jgi:hypothetical protein
MKHLDYIFDLPSFLNDEIRDKLSRGIGVGKRIYKVYESMKNTALLTLFTLLISLSSNPGIAQYHDFDSLYKNDEAFKMEFNSKGISTDLFASDKIMNITIESDFKNLVKRKYKEEYQPALIRYYYNDTIMVVRKITIKSRGENRKSTCTFPPLKFNFPKKNIDVIAMKEFDKMKVVLDCKRGNIYEQYVLSEYYAYRILNLLTAYSFRVRLLHMTYVDTSEKFKTITRYAFIIESKDQLASRIEAIPIDAKNISDKNTHTSTLVNTYLFQYLIGNTDWSIPARHNIQLFKSTNPMITKPYVIPYDFDYAGIVNTSYAIPDENLGTESVTERVYRGVCLPESYIKKAVKNFIENKEEIYALYEKSAVLHKNNRKTSINYIDDFYKIIEKEYGLKRNIIESCR